jgi:hypothetical protein
MLSKRSYVIAITILFLFSINEAKLYAQDRKGVFIDSIGRVGIGKENPMSNLDVNGRIRDSSGYLLPVDGAIILYWGFRTDFEINGVGKKGSKVEGWGLCDGQNDRPKADFVGLSPSYNPAKDVPRVIAEINWGISWPRNLSQDMYSILRPDKSMMPNEQISRQTLFYIVKL